MAPPRRRARPGEIALWATAAAGVTAVYGTLLAQHTDAALPYADSALMALSMAAQLLLMRRKRQTWPFWILVDMLSVPIYAHRGLWLTSALYAVYGGLAVAGWRRWRALAGAA